MKPIKIKIQDWKIFGNIRELPNWEYMISQCKKVRTNQQNKLYWGWFLPHLVQFHQSLWEVCTTQDLHNHFKKILLKKRVYSEYANKRRYVVVTGSTSWMTTKSFKAYMEKINSMYIDIHWYSVPECQDESLLQRVEENVF